MSHKSFLGAILRCCLKTRCKFNSFASKKILQNQRLTLNLKVISWSKSFFWTLNFNDVTAQFGVGCHFRQLTKVNKLFNGEWRWIELRVEVQHLLYVGAGKAYGEETHCRCVYRLSNADCSSRCGCNVCTILFFLSGCGVKLSVLTSFSERDGSDTPTKFPLTQNHKKKSFKALQPDKYSRHTLHCHTPSAAQPCLATIIFQCFDICCFKMPLFANKTLEKRDMLLQNQI